jgi:hypothetical protein
MRRRLITAIALTAAAGLVCTGVAVGEKTTVGHMTVTVGGNVKPKKVSKKKWTPVSLSVSGKVRSDTGWETIPILDKIIVDFDKHGTIDTKGLPTCNPNKLINRQVKPARKACKKSEVGRGKTEAWVTWPDQRPVRAKGTLTAFYGKANGKPAIIFHVWAFEPLGTAFIVTAPIVKSPLKGFGKRVIVNVPTIAGGNGTLTDFSVKIKRTWKHKRKKRSFLLAKCPDRKFTARAQLVWLPDPETEQPAQAAEIGVVRPCKGKR